MSHGAPVLPLVRLRLRRPRNVYGTVSKKSFSADENVAFYFKEQMDKGDVDGVHDDLSEQVFGKDIVITTIHASM